MFLIPTKLIPTALTRLFSLQTKIRMGLELLHPPRPSSQDESVASLVERHFGARPLTGWPIRCSPEFLAATLRN
jgi:oxygen-dependent protoporphyrinogen oxidase